MGPAVSAHVAKMLTDRVDVSLTVVRARLLSGQSLLSSSLSQSPTTPMANGGGGGSPYGHGGAADGGAADGDGGAYSGGGRG